ncbi:NIF family HAD-type phosphatase [Sandaracinus amylolyticus]|uniref:Phosphoprotein phosphatase n=1 Tax=Sandaracinus amylolyticus TaxID=927083 RepID=A0A0F6SHG8_9BACT|nr:HAD family hydrolase [Sandaracinus amylolyticus]AKF10419.1 phosphoprotein phosphatase [Sandaracinus amylolyticus]
MPRFEKLLVLDLDETLVHAREDALERPADHVLFDYHVYERPGVRAFLSHVLDRFHVGVWTSSGERYASGVVSMLFGDRSRLRFVLARDRCVPHRDLETLDTVYLKDIRKLRGFGFAKESILFVDDSPEKIARSYGNLVRVRPFEGDPDDDELPALAAYLDELGAVPDVRAIEKRGWRRRAG